MEEQMMVARTLVSIANSKGWLAAGLLLASAGIAGAQAYTPPTPPLQLGPCVPTKEFPCDPPQKAPPIPASADKFPFPGEPPAAPATAPANGSRTTPANSDSGTTGSGPAKPSPEQQFPFPGEPAGAPAAPAPASGQKPVDSSKFPFPGEPADSASSSSSSSSTSSSSDDSAPAEDPDKAGLKDKGSEGSTRFERKKLAVPEDLSKRELDDLDVSHFYITTGDYVGAYMRAQDAVKLYPDDEMAHFALGLAADKMKKKDEAIAEYKVYLKMAPDGPKAKQVEKALNELGAK
jgi:TolA-binding protein